MKAFLIALFVALGLFVRVAPMPLPAGYEDAAQYEVDGAQGDTCG